MGRCVCGPGSRGARRGILEEWRGGGSEVERTLLEKGANVTSVIMSPALMGALYNFVSVLFLVID